MSSSNLRLLAKPLLTGAALLALMATNTAVSLACRGHAWSLFAVLPLAIAQAGLLVFFAMELPAAGPVPRVYLGLAAILLIVAALTFTDYATRAGALDADAETGRPPASQGSAPP